MQSDRIDGRDADRATDDLLHLLQFAQELVVLVEDLLGRFVDAEPLAGELKLLLAPIDEQRLEMPLHGASLLTDGRLCDAVQLG